MYILSNNERSYLDTMTTIYEVSKQAGVSLATVSRVINKNSAVSPKTREKVILAMNELGYRPNTIAQGLASNRSNSIGVLVSQLDSPFFGEMMVGVEDELRRVGKQVLFAAGHNLESMEKESIEFLQSRFCDGLIIHSEQTSDEYVLALNNAKAPVVLVNRMIPSIKDKCIILNNHKGGYIAGQFAVENGHSDIVYLAGPKNKADTCERLTGFKQALEDANQPLSEDRILFGDYTENSGSDCVTTLFNNKTKVTMLVCANDEMASGAMKQSRAFGLDIPSDLSIMGYDNTSFTKYLYPELTTIENPIGLMGKMAAKLILNLAYGQKHTIQNQFEPKLIIRQSVCKR